MPLVLGVGSRAYGSGLGARPVVAAGLKDPDVPPTALTVTFAVGTPVPSTAAAVALSESTHMLMFVPLSVRLPELTQKDLADVGSRISIENEGVAVGAQLATLRTVTSLVPLTTRLWYVNVSCTSTELVF